MDPSTASAILAGISATSAVATAGIAGYALLGARRDSRDRSRPTVLVRMKSAPKAVEGGITYLVVRNAGSSIARDVRLTFDPAPPWQDNLGNEARVLESIRRRYANPLPVLAPGEQLLNVFRVMTDEGDVLPETITATVHYSDDRGRDYQDDFPLTREVYATATETSRSGANLDKRNVEALEGLMFELWRAVD